MRHLTFALATSLALLGCSTPSSDSERNSERENERAHPHGAMLRWAQRLSADGTVPDNALVRMKDQRDFMLQHQLEGNPGLLGNWQWLGPGNIGGRIRSICIHPTTPNTMWVGSVGGGIWKTTNGGVSWFALDDFAPVMSVGCMILDTKDPNRIYAGTGEGFFDTVAGSSILAASRGAGIFLSTNGGTNWSQIPATKGSDFHFVNRIAISPKDNKVLLVAAGGGIFRSTDSGATYSKRSTEFAMDVDFHPSNDLLAVAGTRDGFAKFSIDGGLTWSTATGITKQERVEVTYAPSNPSIIYAAASLNDRIKVYMSTDGGKSYSLRTTGSGIGTYSRYNNIVWVDPSDANTLLLGGVRLYRSTNGGQSFLSAYSGSYYDYHVVVPHPGYNGTTNQTVYHGNDGGIYRTTSFKASTLRWQELNNNLGITQFYGAAMAPNGTIIGGTQDNGTLRYTGNAQGWVRKIGGDGCYCAADPTNSNYVYGQIYYIRIYRSSNGGQSFSQIATRSKIPDKGSNFIPYMTLDPNNSNRLYFAGASVWRSDNIRGFATFGEVKKALPCTGHDFGSRPIRPDHVYKDPHCNVSVISVAKGNSNIVWVGHNHGEIYMTSNALSPVPTWKKVSVLAQPHRWVGSIAIDPRDNNRVYVSFLGYHKDNVWVTKNGGTSWSQINGTGTGALPESPANWITVHPVVPGCLLLGTDIGLFYSTDDGTSWQTTAEGSTTAPIQELVWKNNRTLMVVTHGRGIYTVDVGQPATVKNLGGACGKAGAPVLTATLPTVGQTQQYNMSGATANAPVALMLAPTTYATPLGNGCTLQVAGTGILLFFLGQTSSTGSWTYKLAIPLSKNVIGAMATLQAVAFTSGGPALGIGELSNGLEMVGGL